MATAVLALSVYLLCPGWANGAQGPGLRDHGRHRRWREGSLVATLTLLRIVVWRMLCLARPATARYILTPGPGPHLGLGMRAGRRAPDIPWGIRVMPEATFCDNWCAPDGRRWIRGMRCQRPMA